MKICKHPTQQELHEILDYDPNTGIFTWKERNATSFKESKWRDRNCKIWNTRHCGRIAGCNRERYATIGIRNKSYLAHRLAYIYMYGDLGDDEIDHFNRRDTDNRIKNLRKCSRIENQINMDKKSSNTTGVVGVGWDKSREQWQVHIGRDKKQYNIGRFDNFKDAVKARYDAEVKHRHTDFNPESSAYKYLQEAQNA